MSQAKCAVTVDCNDNSFLGFGMQGMPSACCVNSTLATAIVSTGSQLTIGPTMVVGIMSGVRCCRSTTDVNTGNCCVLRLVPGQECLDLKEQTLENAQW